jgi:branched-chain amino acid transport system permease protein
MLVAILLQLLVNGILLGTMYGIAAIGLSLIYGTMRILFLAQGAVMILVAYGCFWLFNLWAVDPYASMVIILPGSLIFGVVVYQLLFRKVAGAGQFHTLLIAFGLMVLLENLMSVMFASNSRALRTAYSSYAFNVIGINISFTRVVALAMAIMGTVLVTLFLKRTLLGKAVRAATESIENAMLVGITPHQVNTISFALGVGLAGVAGVATATSYAFNPYSGFVFSLKAMIALALGGMGNVVGALFGGIILGVVESYTSFFVGGGWADVFSYVVFLLVLMLKPEGLLTLDTSIKA